MTRVCSFFALCGLALLVLLALPETALAWGPGVHMVTGNWVLQNLAALPAAVAVPLMLHPGQFLHGALSADIFIGKGCKAKKGHSHNWSSGFALLDAADTPQKTAYAYGYLTHLAADTVAHNVFVPGLFHTAPGSGRIAHVYLEMQADRLLAWDSGDALGVFHEKDSARNAALLRASMHQKALPFWMKTHLFQGSIAVCGSKLWRGSLHALDAMLSGRERSGLLGSMLVLSTRAVFNLLREGEQSPLLALDPIGARALARAEIIRHRKRRLVGKAAARALFAAPHSVCKAKAGQSEFRIPIPRILEELPAVCAPPSPEDL